MHVQLRKGRVAVQNCATFDCVLRLRDPAHARAMSSERTGRERLPSAKSASRPRPVVVRRVFRSVSWIGVVSFGLSA